MLNNNSNTFIRKSILLISIYISLIENVFGEYYSTENNVVNIINKNFNLCLTYKAKDNIARASDCNNNDLKQQWIVPKIGNGYYVSRYDTNICLFLKDNGSVITTGCSENKTMMGNLSASKSKEAIWTPSNGNLCMGILSDDLPYVNDATVRKAASIKLKMNSCSSSKKDQHWKFNVLTSNFKGSSNTTNKATIKMTSTKKVTSSSTVATLKKTTTTAKAKTSSVTTLKKTTPTLKSNTTTTITTIKKTTPVKTNTITTVATIKKTTPAKTNTITTKTSASNSSSQKVLYTPIIMSESDKELSNPYIGWFHGATTIDLTDYPELDCNFINRFHQVQKYKNGLQYLGVRLGEFSNRKISKKALTALDNLLNEYRKRKETIDPTTQLILRFYYDGENNCKTKDSSFEPIISSIDNDSTQPDNINDNNNNNKINNNNNNNNNNINTNEDNDTEDTQNKFSQLDDGHLYVNYEDIEYLKQEYNPDILYENTVQILSGNEKEESTNEKENGNGRQEIAYLSSDNELKFFNLTTRDNIKYFDQRYYNEYNELTLTKEEMDDYLHNSIFLNDKLNKTKVLELKKKTNRATVDEEFIIRNATEKDFGNYRVNAAKELKQISFRQCIQKSETNKNICLKEKIVKSYCIYQFKSNNYANGCERYTTQEIEPENINMVLIHITQLSDIVNKYKDLIYIYQGAFVGTFGEMHHSNYLDLDSLTQIMDTIDKTFDPSIFLSVRTPRYYRGINNMFSTTKGANYTSFINRMSLFNDGLFHKETDYGTYGQSDITEKDGYVKAKRLQEVQFQAELCLNVPNGGEGVYDKQEDKYINLSDITQINKLISKPEAYNNFYVSDQHARNIHVSYLNEEFDKNLFNHWSNTTSTSIPTENWNLNGRDYIGNHLGYRYVIRNSKLLSNNTLNIVIENVGYAPSYKPFKTTVFLKSLSPSQVIELNIDTDNKKWGFIKQNGEYVKTVTLSVDLKKVYSKFKSKNYEVYFNVHDPRTGVDIKFGNSNIYYTNCGYQIGVLTTN
ncbi:hypothetical protein PIROE2DRAFT_1144 [Piromyces sp. E2]|nr:hypothetical protein PIROE2DRAFT_1144 [Piromyces sp. E2]|eukprot:OUM70617.1 hypothetical protein PIROE2DRAFT_1144 [Piromyces sp. E2]